MIAPAQWMENLPGCRRAAVVFALGWLAVVPAPAQVPREYDMKAVFLYNFVTFTDWPPEAFSAPDSPYVIGVIGADPFGNALDEMVNGEQIKGRLLVVRRFVRVEDAARCHILFISASEARRLKDILERVRGRPVLTVGDLPGFAQAGGGIAFTPTAQIGLVINPAALHQARLAISAKLLRLAQLLPEPSP